MVCSTGPHYILQSMWDLSVPQYSRCLYGFALYFKIYFFLQLEVFLFFLNMYHVGIFIEFLSKHSPECPSLQQVLLYRDVPEKIRCGQWSKVFIVKCKYR